MKLRSMIVGFGALLAACAPAVPGTARVVLDLQPAARPKMAGAYDFELLGALSGQACVSRAASPAAGATQSTSWFSGVSFAGVSKDPITLHAVSAAIVKALDKDPEADTLVLTRAVVDVTGEQACAEIAGRGVHLTKAGPSGREALRTHDLKDPRTD